MWLCCYQVYEVILNVNILYVFAATAHDDDVKDAAGASKESHVHPTRRAASSSGNG